MNDQIKPGDWVNSYSKGIFRVERIVEKYFEESDPDLANHRIGAKRKDRTIVSKRLLNDSMKKSTGAESCSDSFVSPLNPDQQAELDRILLANPSWLARLDEYQIPSQVTTYNMRLKLRGDDVIRSFDPLKAFIDQGKTFPEIEAEMKRLDLFRFITQSITTHTLQFTNTDDEIRDKRKVWKAAKLIKF